MKKITIIAISLLLAGCSSVDYHTGKNSLLMQNTLVQQAPLQADIKAGGKITGTAECEKWFGLSIKKPNKQTYGAELQVPSGNFAPKECTRGALYDALNKNNADTIIAPHYTVVRKSEGCVFGICIHQIYQIIITGYKGNINKITSIKQEEEQEPKELL